MLVKDYKAGTYEKLNDYKAFLPSPINHDWTWDSAEINKLLEKANIELGSLKSYSELIPNIDLYIQMHIKIEANKSSRIEGTQTTIEEELMPIVELNPEKRDDVAEVHNYIKALEYGVKRITVDEFPLSSRLIREIHAILLEGVRGEYKTPGEYRKSQNWIGGTMPSTASYVPPVFTRIPELITDIEMFIHNEDIYVPELIKIAIIHYQFESIHPFLDGNGRTGRILIPLLLLNSEILTKPSFYISNYFEVHRTEYYDTLNRVRMNDDLEGWIKFFLQAAIETARDARSKFEKAVNYVENLNERAAKIPGSTENIQKILKEFYQDPAQTSADLAGKVGITGTTANRILKALENENIVTEETGYSRNRVYMMRDYVNLFK